MAKTSKTVTETTELTKKKTAKKEPLAVAESIPQIPVQLKNVETYSRFSDFDVNLFKAGKHYRLFEKFGSHIVDFQGVKGD